MLPAIAVAAALVLLYLFLLLPRLPRRDIAALRGHDYAHRGLWDADTPENSLPAFRRAAEGGFGVELDVHLTADGQLVVFHDDTLTRMCGDPRAVSACTLSELRRLRLAGSRETIPTLDEVLSAVAGRVPLIVELKSDGNIEALAAATRERMRRYGGPWCVESFDPRAVRWFRRHAPEIIRGQLAFGRGTRKRTAVNVLVGTLLQNVLGRPDFIAYEAETDRTFAMAAMRLMRPTLVCWTIRSQAQMNAQRGRYDLQIFEGFVPKR